MGGRLRGRGDQSLGALWESVRAARQVVDAQRTEPRNARRTREAQQDYLCALEAYVDAVTEHGQTVPYQLRDEVVLYRALSSEK